MATDRSGAREARTKSVSAAGVDEAADGGVKTLEKALRLLETLAKRQPIGVTALARELDVPKSQVSRFLKTLARNGYASKLAEDGRFVLGRQALALARSAHLPRELIAMAAEPMGVLAKAVQASVHLGVLDGSEVLIIAKAESPLRLQLTTQVGQRSPAHVTAMGKVLLAGISDDERRALLAHYTFQSFTPNTVPNKEAMEKEVALTRRRGYAVEKEEEHLGVGCLAAPIADAAGRTVAALSISGPLAGTPFHLAKSNIQQVVKVAEELSRRLRAS